MNLLETFQIAEHELGKRIISLQCQGILDKQKESQATLERIEKARSLLRRLIECCKAT